MPPKSNIPIRICGSKTRTGCRTCKQRHIKCDEQRPICVRCQKAKRACAYDPPQVSAPDPMSSSDHYNRHDVVVAPRYLNMFQRPVLDRSVSPFGPRDLVEAGAVQTFTTLLGKELAGCFSNDVWCDILPRVAQHEPSIWHGMAAVSLLDTSLRMGHDPEGNAGEIAAAIRQYSKAIKLLNMRLSTGEPGSCKDVILLSCIIFAIFECLQNHTQSALRHISAGVKLLMEWGCEAQSRDGKRAGVYLDHTSLQPMFLVLDSQAIQLGDVTFKDYLSMPAIDSYLQIPASFTNTDEAHLALSQIFNRLSHWAYWFDPSLDHKHKPSSEWLIQEELVLRIQLAKWDVAFDNPLLVFSPESTMFLLSALRKVTQAFFDRHNGPDEMEWDKSLPLFQEAVEHLEAYMALEGNTTPESTPSRNSSASPSQLSSFDTPRPTLAIAMDVVLPLFLISTKCRHPSIRRRALKLLKICGRKEGIWDSHTCAALAEKMIELEESNASADGFIPEAARIYMLDVRLGEETGGEVIHQRLVEDDDGVQRVQSMNEVMSW